MATELRIPEHIADDPNAREILRVWVSDDMQKFALRTGTWDDPAAWGVLLVDLARHIARGIATTRGEENDAVLARIKAGFDAEWAVPTDQE